MFRAKVKSYVFRFVSENVAVDSFDEDDHEDEDGVTDSDDSDSEGDLVEDDGFVFELTNDEQLCEDAAI